MCGWAVMQSKLSWKHGIADPLRMLPFFSTKEIFLMFKPPLAKNKNESCASSWRKIQHQM